ncbi:phosphohydrolase [Aquabacterium sp. A7-Y]|uniref:phosphohydrolase n=1 Tax=Aquabacterium sp. A7-Y TaxID=1349605 RepID=UPI0039FD184C
MHALDRIEALFAEHGDVFYDGARHEAVTALQHALQCAQLAECARAPAALVAAALLHDIGHFAAALPDAVDDGHEQRAVPFLATAFPPAVVEPIRLHVAAKRCLVAMDAAYAATLSPASVHSLTLQGGPMSAADCAAFRQLPFAEDALQLRRWDDAAKLPGRRTPSLRYYLALLAEVGLGASTEDPGQGSCTTRS